MDIMGLAILNKSKSCWCPNEKPARFISKAADEKPASFIYKTADEVSIEVATDILRHAEKYIAMLWSTTSRSTSFI